MSDRAWYELKFDVGIPLVGEALMENAEPPIDMVKALAPFFPEGTWFDGARLTKVDHEEHGL